MSDIDEALSLLGDAAIPASKLQQVPVMPLSSKALNDDIFACGGVPRGKAIEVLAKSSVGKSTFVQWLAGQIQSREYEFDGVKRRGLVAWFDAEKSLVADYATGSGMDLTRTAVIDFGLGNDMCYKLKQCIASDMFDLIVLDSMQTVVPDSVSDVSGTRSMRDKLALSSMWAQFFSELQGGFTVRDAKGRIIKNKNPPSVYDFEDSRSRKSLEPDENVHRLSGKRCCLVMISHAKTKIETGFGAGRGDKTYSSGGDEKDFAFAIRIHMVLMASKKAKVKGERVLKYREVKIRSMKNKLGIPLKEHTFLLGIDGSLRVDDSDLEEIEVDQEAGASAEENEAIESYRKKAAEKRFQEEARSGEEFGIGGEDEDDEEEDENAARRKKANAAIEAFRNRQRQETEDDDEDEEPNS